NKKNQISGKANIIFHLNLYSRSHNSVLNGFMAKIEFFPSRSFVELKKHFGFLTRAIQNLF
ncbi:MAG: hypothetical protein LBF22_01055, partial [Deltaproteobacteria bacterium]|nr:hypothetical protein [Deltaproteobacteria bacterium]